MLLFLLLSTPLIIGKFQKRPRNPKFYIQAIPNNTANPATYATSVAYSPDGQTLACAFAIERRREVVRDQLWSWIETQIRFYDAQTGAYRQKLQEVSGAVHNIEFSPDGKTLRAVCEDGSTRWWDVHTGQIARSIKHNDAYPIAFSLDGRWQLASHLAKTPPFNNTIFLRDNNTGKTIKRRSTGHTYISSAAFSTDNKEFVLVTSENLSETAQFYRTSDFKLLSTQNWNTGDVFWIKFIGKSQIVGVYGHPFMWHSNIKIRWFESLKGDYRNGAISKDNRLLATGGWRVDPPWQSRFTFEYNSETDPNANFSHVGIWQIETGKCVWNMRTGGKNVVSIALAPDNSRVAVAVSDTMPNINNQPRGHVEVWTLPAGLDKE